MHQAWNVCEHTIVHALVYVAPLLSTTGPGGYKGVVDVAAHMGAEIKELALCRELPSGMFRASG
jgi:hypothetical protein